MVYPEQLRIDGVNYRLQALHSPEGGDDVKDIQLGRRVVAVAIFTF